ncbi:MAG: hypothetical protein A3G88_01410 [Omnitrophica WOR_2 bacterium RIFCSPLOWO2_12_FULL_63_16]|nr:MAG: hypothetical protein A3G88_01410 [Omnitrophica WOR_2 bacterium RIFCSPLOWO2_12_FULL_63_16]
MNLLAFQTISKRSSVPPMRVRFLPDLVLFSPPGVFTISQTGIALKNAFGFGGKNSALVIRKYAIT